MTDNLCPCTAKGVYSHHIDNDVVWLCAKCHAVLRCIIQNISGTDIQFYLQMCDKRGDYVYLRGWEQEDPAAVVEPVKSVKSTPVLNENSIFIPIRQNHNEIVRRPPSKHTTVSV